MTHDHDQSRTCSATLPTIERDQNSSDAESPVEEVESWGYVCELAHLLWASREPFPRRCEAFHLAAGPAALASLTCSRCASAAAAITGTKSKVKTTRCSPPWQVPAVMLGAWATCLCRPRYLDQLTPATVRHTGNMVLHGVWPSGWWWASRPVGAHGQGWCGVLQLGPRCDHEAVQGCWPVLHVASGTHVTCLCGAPICALRVKWKCVVV